MYFVFIHHLKKKSTAIANKTTKGLEYFLDTKESDQDDINRFIKLCRNMRTKMEILQTLSLVKLYLIKGSLYQVHLAIIFLI